MKLVLQCICLCLSSPQSRAAQTPQRFQKGERARPMAASEITLQVQAQWGKGSGASRGADLRAASRAQFPNARLTAFSRRRCDLIFHSSTAACVFAYERSTDEGSPGMWQSQADLSGASTSLYDGRRNERPEALSCTVDRFHTQAIDELCFLGRQGKRVEAQLIEHLQIL